MKDCTWEWPVPKGESLIERKLREQRETNAEWRAMLDQISTAPAPAALEREKVVAWLRRVAQARDGRADPEWAIALNEAADGIEAEEHITWDAAVKRGESLIATRKQAIADELWELRAAVDRTAFEASIDANYSMTEKHPPCASFAMPPFPVLGGGVTPQRWLRWMAEYDRGRDAFTRAAEAEQIAEWIDAVTATPEPSEGEGEREQALPRETQRERMYREHEEEKKGPARAFPEPSSRAGVRGRVRDELEEIVRSGIYDDIATSVIVDDVLDKLIERGRASNFLMLSNGFLKRVKAGEL